MSVNATSSSGSPVRGIMKSVFTGMMGPASRFTESPYRDSPHFDQHLPGSTPMRMRSRNGVVVERAAVLGVLVAAAVDDGLHRLVPVDAELHASVGKAGASPIEVAQQRGAIPRSRCSQGWAQAPRRERQADSVHSPPPR